LLNQFYLPLPIPFLELLFSRHRGDCMGMRFKPYQLRYPVFFGKALNHAFPMFPNPFHQVRSNAKIQSAIAGAGEHINVESLVHLPMGSRLRGNDGDLRQVGST
jgi:hypothetical protein